ncbi:hydroxysqualene dehydroxylase HpnE [Chromobacterium sphagni]|uniref:Phytoene desaturase n=1 Tax=Chromobacterium sphagni TaxID=1903179 RepID=A0ABX3CFP2_9NEIS|nr:hydroxysqualene dehydroxylase HpnE [Chromobacterium sphagni]OHX20911.1 phytoene desaturase [Chromobacterium sphagni]
MENLDLRLPAVKPRVAVVGAGWAGLAAAVELAGKADLTVLEAGREPGGRARCGGRNGDRFDNGQHILLGAYAECLRLMRRVGAPPETLLLRRPLQWWREGGVRMQCPRWPAPLHLAAGLLTARGLSWQAKWQLARALRNLQAASYRLSGDCSVADWLGGQGQQAEVVREFWRPLVLSALNTPPELASMQVLATVLRDSLGASREASDLLLPASDLSALFPDPAWRWLAAQGADLRVGRRVSQLAREPDSVLVDGEEYDAVVLAAAPYHAAVLLDGPCLSAQLQGYQYWPIVTVYLRFTVAPQLPAPMMGVRGGMVDWLFDREALAGESGLVAAVISAPQSLPSSDALVRGALDDLRRLAPHLPAPLASKVIVEKRATFASVVGLKRPAVRDAGGRVYLAGDWVCPDYPATLEGAVRSGVAAAAAVMQDLRMEP